MLLAKNKKNGIIQALESLASSEERLCNILVAIYKFDKWKI